MHCYTECMTKTTLTLERSSTLFLRIAVTTIGLGVLALCVFLLPVIWTDAYQEFPRCGYAVRAVVAAMYVSALPFYVGIYKGWQVLHQIDKGRVFSTRSVKALQAVAYCAAAVGLIYTLSLPFFYIWAQYVDAPGLMVIGMFLVGMPLIVSVAVGLLARLLREAVSIKFENDLTV